jgi:hypothetical protein
MFDGHIAKDVAILSHVGDDNRIKRRTENPLPVSGLLKG